MHVIVFGNEKGGSGKSTTCMHVATALCRDGHRTAAIDLDVRQRSLGRYLENRAARNASSETMVATPLPVAFPPGGRGVPATADEAREVLAEVLRGLEGMADFVVIDCPGAFTPLSQAAHERADTLVTPLNDSFVDFDLLARLDPETGTARGPSVYSEMVWRARQLRAREGLPPIDWVVLRNRLGVQFMHNKRKVGTALTDLSRRIGFRVIPGLTERVVFRELFPQGLTILDLADAGTGGLNLSNIAARQEMRELMAALALPTSE
ncbi:MAG: AAA family ATPase [Rhodobacteraceae bacterium]|nr:AAA family ATPase [Paracoccaceae bacterium]